MNEEEFLRDEKTQDAVIRNFEIIGKASLTIERYHPAFAAEHSDTSWPAEIFQATGDRIQLQAVVV